MLAVNSLGSGLIMPVWSDWYAKTVSEGVWARLLGMRMAVFGLLALPLGWLNGWVVANHAGAARYVLLLGGALFFYLLSTLSLSSSRRSTPRACPTTGR